MNDTSEQLTGTTADFFGREPDPPTGPGLPPIDLDRIRWDHVWLFKRTDETLTRLERRRYGRLIDAAEAIANLLACPVTRVIVWSYRTGTFFADYGFATEEHPSGHPGDRGVGSDATSWKEETQPFYEPDSPKGLVVWEHYRRLSEMGATCFFTTDLPVSDDGTGPSIYVSLNLGPFICPPWGIEGDEMCVTFIAHPGLENLVLVGERCDRISAHLQAYPLTHGGRR